MSWSNVAVEKAPAKIRLADRPTAPLVFLATSSSCPEELVERWTQIGLYRFEFSSADWHVLRQVIDEAPEKRGGILHRRDNLACRARSALPGVPSRAPRADGAEGVLGTAGLRISPYPSCRTGLPAHRQPSVARCQPRVADDPRPHEVATGRRNRDEQSWKLE